MKTDLVALIEQSDLSEEDKKMWREALRKLDEKTIVILQDIAGGNPEKLRAATMQIKKEAEAIRNRDLAALDTLLHREL